MISEEFVTKVRNARGKPKSYIYEQTDLMDPRKSKTNISVGIDIAIVTGTGRKRHLDKNMNISNEVLAKNGMKLNKTKSKVITISEEREKIQIRIEGKRIQHVDTFQYLEKKTRY